MATGLTIWANPFLTASSEELLIRSTAAHKLILAQKAGHVLEVGTLDPRLLEAEIVFGQPDPATIVQSERLRWLQLSSAGYARYDNQEIRSALEEHAAKMTNSSSVYDQPCAEHLMAWLLADVRQLYPSYDNQRGAHGWPQNELRQNTHLLAGQTVFIVVYGAIGARLAELLAPYAVHLIGYRRTMKPGSSIPVVGPADLASTLAAADHVINILPENSQTRNFFDSERLRQIKAGARYYSIGRGTTTEQEALAENLKTGHLQAAYLDVTDPEPLPPDHSLWSAPNCYITPHTGGGHFNETDRLVGHFVENLRRYEEGREPIDRVF
ncbi:MAG: D-2-hydroxyacid dehydrogenase [Verrucomicrobia bacterium]|nr:D-2-hydroxyacid dehydrogenase [Verrucomicrobiota bacterium]